MFDKKMLYNKVIPEGYFFYLGRNCGKSSYSSSYSFPGPLLRGKRRIFIRHNMRNNIFIRGSTAGALVIVTVRSRTLPIHPSHPISQHKASKAVYALYF